MENGTRMKSISVTVRSGNSGYIVVILGSKWEKSTRKVTVV